MGTINLRKIPNKNMYQLMVRGIEDEDRVAELVQTLVNAESWFSFYEVLVQEAKVEYFIGFGGTRTADLPMPVSESSEFEASADPMFPDGHFDDWTERRVAADLAGKLAEQDAADRAEDLARYDKIRG